MAALIASPDSSLCLLHSPPHQPQTPHTLLAPSKQPCDCHRPLVPLADRETTPGTSRTINDLHPRQQTGVPLHLPTLDAARSCSPQLLQAPNTPHRAATPGLERPRSR